MKNILISFITVSALSFGLTACIVPIETPSSSEPPAPSTNVEAGNTAESEAAQSSAAPTPTSFGLGDTLTIDGIDFTLNSATATTEGQLSTSPDEEIFLVLDLTVENKSSEEISLSTLLSFSLRGSDAYEYDLALFVDTKGSLDTSVAPGATVRGQIAFDVPNLDSYQLSVTPTLFSDSGYFTIFSTDVG